MIISDEEIRSAILKRVDTTVVNVINKKLSKIVSEAVEDVFKKYFEKQLTDGLNEIMRDTIEEILGDFVKEHKENIMEVAEKVLKDELNNSRMFRGMPFNINL